jgi:hypothetical protein
MSTEDVLAIDEDAIDGNEGEAFGESLVVA